MRRPAAVIFDMDGTLLDTETLFIKLWQQEDPSDDPRLLQCLTDVIGTTHAYTKEHFRECFGPDYPYDSIRKKVDENLDRCRREGLIPLKPGAKEILEKLEKSNANVGNPSEYIEDIRTAIDYTYKDQYIIELKNGFGSERDLVYLTGDDLSALMNNIVSEYKSYFFETYGDFTFPDN